MSTAQQPSEDRAFVRRSLAAAIQTLLAAIGLLVMDVPMLVILLGAIGGMIMSGIIGLFIGAVILALGYKLFMFWLTESR